VSTHAEFRPDEPLPEATMLLEASAGTGKTHSITSIVLRLVAEHDIPIEQLLVVTFTRAAAAELRGRIRDRIARAVDALEDWPAAPLGDDEVIALLAGGDVPEEQVRARLERLRAARSHVDDATIDTIHGFCARMIQQAGPLVGIEPGAELQEDLSLLVGEVVNDLLARAASDRVLGVHRRLEGDLRPDTLVDLVARLEARPDVRVVGADPQADLAGEWTTLVDRFAARWAAQRDAFADWVVATREAGGFRKGQRTYNADRLATHAAAIDAWLAGERVLGGLGEVEGALDWLGRRAIEGYLASGAVPDLLDVVDLAEEVRLTHARLSDRVRARLVGDAVEEVARRKRDAGVLSFSDLLSSIASALDDPAVAGAVRAAIRARYGSP
jgi:ATP-dependent exoDNAse (exonuclease V) beta subunit